MSKFHFKPIIENKELTNQKEKYHENEVEGIIEEDKDIVIPHIDHPIMEPTEVIKIKSVPDINEAQERNNNNNPPCSILTTACGSDDSNSVCLYKEDCPILNAYDKMIYERLEKNEVIAIEVRWCHKYEPRYKFR